MGFYEAERVMAAESWRPSRRKGMPTKKKEIRAARLPAVSHNDGKALYSISEPNLISAFCNSRGYHAF